MILAAATEAFTVAVVVIFLVALVTLIGVAADFLYDRLLGGGDD